MLKTTKRKKKLLMLAHYETLLLIKQSMRRQSFFIISKLEDMAAGLDERPKIGIDGNAEGMAQ